MTALRGEVLTSSKHPCGALASPARDQAGWPHVCSNAAVHRPQHLHVLSHGGHRFRMSHTLHAISRNPAFEGHSGAQSCCVRLSGAVCIDLGNSFQLACCQIPYISIAGNATVKWGYDGPMAVETICVYVTRYCPISARMGLTHNDANIAFYNFTDGAPGGIKGPNGDDYFYPHTQVDAQVSYLLPHMSGVHMTVSFLNLTNEVFGFYQGSEQFPIQLEYYSRTISAGFRWTSSPDVK